MSEGEWVKERMLEIEKPHTRTVNEKAETTEGNGIHVSLTNAPASGFSELFRHQRRHEVEVWLASILLNGEEHGGNSLRSPLSRHDGMK